MVTSYFFYKLFSFLLFAKALENIVASKRCPDEKENIGSCHQLGILTTIARSKMNDHKNYDRDSYNSHKHGIENLQYIILHNSIY